MRPNQVFNNQILPSDVEYYVSGPTHDLKKKIVTQLQGKTRAQQEQVIEGLLKLLDVNLLAALDMAYSIAPTGEE
jgi:hypothetical protein